MAEPWESAPIVDEKRAAAAAPWESAPPVDQAPAPAAGLQGPLKQLGAAAVPGVDPQWAAGQAPAQIAATQREARAKANPVRDKVVGAVEGALDVLAKVVGGTAGGTVGLLASPLTGKTAEQGMQSGAETGVGLVRDVYRQLQITDGSEPQTETGQAITGGFDTLMENAPPIVGVHGTLAGPATPTGLGARQSAQLAGESALRGLEGPVAKIKQAVEAVTPEKAPTPGTKGAAGAAATDMATQRRERAAALPVPVKLTKGQAERTFEGQRFEKETAKDPEAGAPLRERNADQVDQITKNFDEFIDQTGAIETDPKNLGERVVDPIVEKANKAKKEIRDAYDAADAAGETAQLVPYDKVKAYLDEQTPTAREKLAPILKMAEEQIAKNDPNGDGVISIKALEDVRKAIRANTEFGTPNQVHASELIRRIDESTANAGGDLYQGARKLYSDYAREFKEKGVIRDLINLKKNSSDRKVAFEDVFNRVVTGRGTLDDLKNVRDTLVSAGPKGEQAWKDMRGTAVAWVRDQTFGNTATNERGAKIPSADKLAKAVKKLDEDGKLEFLFGKQGAQQMRDVSDIVADINTAPPGAVNTSNTASVLKQAFDTMVTYGMSGVPVPAFTALKAALKKVKERKVAKGVREALGDDTPLPAQKTRAFEEPPAPPPAAPAPRGTPPKGPKPTPQAEKLPVGEAKELTTEQAEAVKPTKRETELARLRDETTDPDVIKDLDTEIAAERKRAGEQRRGEEFLRLADKASDPDVRASLEAKAKKLGVERKPEEPIPAGEATELPPETGRGPDLPAVPTGEATELGAAQAVEALKLNAEQMADWQKTHHFGDLDAAAAQEVVKALRYDAAAVETARQQFKSSPRAFEREIARIIEEGKARESQTQQAGRSGQGPDATAGGAARQAGADEGQPRPDGDAAARADGQAPDATGRQAQTVLGGAPAQAAPEPPALRRATGAGVSKEREARIQEAKDLAGDLPKEIADDAVKILRQYDGPPPVDVPPKTHARLTEFITPLIEKAKTVNEAFSQQVRDLAGKLGAEAKTAPVKGAKRAIEKLYLDELESGLQAWPESIGDLVRASIVVKNEADVAAAIKAVRENLDVIRVKDRFNNPLPTGYRDVLINVRLPNGMKAELQIHVPEMLKAKELGHLLYEVQRVSPEGPERAALLAAQQRLYGAAYDLSAARREPGGQASTSLSNSARPISTTPSQEASARPVGAATSPPASDQKAGSPSRSKNLAPEGGLTASTGGILADAPAGKQAVVTTERGMRVPVQYRVAEVGQLVTSHDDALKANPAFPPELQPRDRTRQSSADQINRIANDIRPEWMAESPKASDGAPIIGADAIVESGNARTMALRRAYAIGKADAYREWLIENAERFGLTPDQVKAMKEPVLVRQGLGEYDRAEFTKQANEQTVAEVSATERARADAQRLPDLEGLKVDEDGKVNMAASSDWVRAFMRDTVEPNKRGEIMTSSGELSQTGERRIQNALFMAAYDDGALMERMAEATDPAGKNIISGMLRAAPDVAKLRDMVKGGARDAPTWIDPLVEAVRRFGDAREAGQTVAQYLAQGSLLGGEASPAVATMMQNLEAFSRAPRRLADHIKALARESAKDPRQSELLEPRPPAYGQPRQLADDLAAQQEFLAQRASAAGYKSLDEFVAGDFEGFMRAADEWRQRNPEDVLREPEPDLLSAQTPADLKAKADREARAAAADKAEQQRLADKARADAMRDEFTLTGSDRPADNVNQGSLFEKQPQPETQPYDVDLFGNPVPPVPAPKKRTAAAPTPVLGLAPPKSSTEAPAGRYATRAALVTTREQKLGHAGPVKSLSDAAHALAYLGKSAVERLDAIVTDTTGKPLAIIGGFKGALAQTSVYPATLLGEAMQIPNAGRIWLVHNHPSGKSTLSEADKYMVRQVQHAFDGTAISTEGILAVGNGEWSGVDQRTGFKFDETGKLKPADGGTVPAQERQLVENGKLGPQINSPIEAKRVVEEMVQANGGRPTIVLVDSQHHPVAAIPWDRNDAMPLKNNGNLDALLRAVAQANAGAALIGTGRKDLAMNMAEAQNIGAALAKADVRVLDIIDANNGSAAEKGLKTSAAVLRAAGGGVVAAGLGLSMANQESEDQ